MIQLFILKSWFIVHCPVILLVLSNLLFWNPESIVNLNYWLLMKILLGRLKDVYCGLGAIRGWSLGGIRPSVESSSSNPYWINSDVFRIGSACAWACLLYWEQGHSPTIYWNGSYKVEHWYNRWIHSTGILVLARNYLLLFLLLYLFLYSCSILFVFSSVIFVIASLVAR